MILISVLELIAQKVSLLPEEKQLEGLDFVEFLIHKMESENKANTDTIFEHPKTSLDAQH